MLAVMLPDTVINAGTLSLGFCEGDLVVISCTPSTKSFTGCDVASCTYSGTGFMRHVDFKNQVFPAYLLIRPP
jgi:hypothetical protein